MKTEIESQLSFSDIQLIETLLQLRCPSCRKLYQVDSRELLSAHPQFDCKICKVTFTFDNPPTEKLHIPTRLVRTFKQNQQKNELRTEAPELKKCGQCAKLNPRAATECYHCGIVFEKSESVTPELKQLGALPSLMKAWSELIKDYSNISKHVAFVDRCEDLQALPFALKKYQELKDLQPQDSVATKMFKSVLFRNISARTQKIPYLLQFKNKLQQINWRRVAKISPFAISMALILFGLVKPGWRNLIGGGVSFLFLTIGLHITLKGRFRLSDFWK